MTNSSIDNLSRNVAIVEPSDELENKIEVSRKENRPLTVKLGFDPTAPDLHLGHSVVLQKLKDFQDAGHKVVVIVGDFTALIGDPTGRNKARPPLSKDEVRTNAETYVSQLGMILNIREIDIRYNSEWFDNVNMSDVIKLMSGVTLAQLMQRDDFKNRFNGNVQISLHELLYPIMQGYDSIMIEADVEIGGTDQLFNCMMGRTMQQARNMQAQSVVCMPLLLGLDGKEKMSKSSGNYIGLLEDPKDIYGKTMSISDNLLPDYIRFAANFSDERCEEALGSLASGENPMIIKKDVAYSIVERFHGADRASKAASHFDRTVQKNVLEEADYKHVQIDELLNVFRQQSPIVDVIQHLNPEFSKSQIRRLMLGGGVRISNEKVMDPNHVIELVPGTVIRIGKRLHYKLDTL